MQRVGRKVTAEPDDTSDAQVPFIGINPGIEATTTPNAGKWALWTTFGMGLWLLLSAFAFPQLAASRVHSAIVGVLVLVISGSAWSVSRLRLLNSLAGLWIVLSALVVFDLAAATRWNNVVVGAVVFAASLLSTQPRYART